MFGRATIRLGIGHVLVFHFPSRSFLFSVISEAADFTFGCFIFSDVAKNRDEGDGKPCYYFLRHDMDSGMRIRANGAETVEKEAEDRMKWTDKWNRNS